MVFLELLAVAAEREIRTGLALEWFGADPELKNFRGIALRHFHGVATWIFAGCKINGEGPPPFCRVDLDRAATVIDRAAVGRLDPDSAAS